MNVFGNWPQARAADVKDQAIKDAGNVIHVPSPVMSEHKKEEIATEESFNALLNSLRKHDVKLKPVMGLMELPSQELTRQFQEACRAIIDMLRDGAQ